MTFVPDPPLSRRDFVKNAAAGSAALGAMFAGLPPSIFVPGKARVDLSEGGVQYHPHIDPLRVVGIKDPAMTLEVKPTAPWKAQDRLVVAERVAENIERLACTLTEEKSARDAWKKIFIKPPGKEWNETLVAIKTNNIARQHTHSAVMEKVCRVLIEEIGVKPSNIFIYDGCHGGDMLRKTPFQDIPEDCHVASTWGGFSGKTIVPKPFKDGKRETLCVKAFAEDKVDILVNIALTKGHALPFGGFTMLMKNHFGTFSPRPYGHSDGNTDYLIAINQTRHVLGKVDAKTHRVTYPRQQLCLIDALWASQDGPGCPSSAQPDRLYMGTFAPAIDHLVARNFRVKEMGWRINEDVAKRFLTDFGFSPEKLPREGKILELGAA